MVQLYVGTEPNHDRPVRELKAFDKVLIPAGETVKVALQLPKDAFARYNEAQHQWELCKGVHKLQICADANTVLLEQTVEI